VVCACVSSSAPAKDIEQIASTSLCGDGYVLALIGDQAPQRVAALSWQSRDALSLAPETYRALPQLWDDPEIILASGAEHIVFGPGEGAQARRVSGNPDPVILDIETRLSQLIKPNIKPKILYLDRAGASAGSGTFVDAVITAAGGENIIQSSGWSNPDPEILLGLAPDLILTSYFEDGYESINALPVRHAALKAFIARHERLEIPGALWPCAGPHLVTAVEILNAKIISLP